MSLNYPFPLPAHRKQKAWLGDGVLTLAVRVYYQAYPRPSFPDSAILSNDFLAAYSKHINIGRRASDRATIFEAYVWEMFLKSGFPTVMEEVKLMVAFRSTSSYFNLTKSNPR